MSNILDWLLGTSSQDVGAAGASNTKGTTTQQAAQEQATGTNTAATSQTGSVASQATTQQQGQTGTTQTLSDPVLARINDLVSTTPANSVSGQTKGAVKGNVDTAGALARLAALTPSVIANSTQAATDQATLDWNRGENAQIQQTKQNVGSTDNSLVQLLQSQGNQDLQTQLATIRANSAVQGQSAGVDALTKAVAAGSQASTDSQNADTAGNATIQALASLIYSAKGGVSQSDVNSITAGTQDTSANATTNSLTNVLQGLLTEAASSGTTTTDVATSGNTTTDKSNPLDLSAILGALLK